MARIYKASTSGDRVFTLKKILPDYSDNEEFIRMFLEEAKISLSLKHPNIVRVLDFGQIEGSYYLAMEYVFGKDIGSLLRASVENKIHLPIDVACYIILQCCRGLHYVHTLTNAFGENLGVIHRDISPPNILVSYNGEAKVLDFGIAKAVRAANSGNTRSGVLKGKFCYMSPEQASGTGLTHQSDIFSLGIVLHELLTSRSLFYSKDEIETLERVRKAAILPPSQHRKGLPRKLDKIVLKALQKKTNKRYASCSEFADALQDFLSSNYPRTDARSVAKFLRQIFSEDFSQRMRKAKEEKWRDVLVSGGADDQILLDRDLKALGHSQALGPASTERPVDWFQRAIYDPRTTRRLRRTAFLSVFVLSLLGTGFYSYWDKDSWPHQTAISLYSKFSSSDEDEVSSLASTGQKPPVPRVEAKAEESRSAPERGSLSYWVQEADRAEGRRDYRAAREALQRALRVSPFDELLQARFHYLGIELGEIDQSCQWLREARELPSEEKNFAHARCLEAQGEAQRALREYQELLRRYPEHPKRAEVQRRLQDLSQLVSR